MRIKMSCRQLTYIIYSMAIQKISRNRRQIPVEREENVVEGMSEEQMLRLKEQKRERRRQKQIENKKKYMPLYKYLKKQGLKFKTATVGDHTIQYFRLDNLEALLEFKQKEIEADKKIKRLLENRQNTFFHYKRIDNQPHFRYPQILEECEDVESSKFASFKFSSNESSITSTLVILGVVVALVLFPLWPYELKYFIFLVCLYLLVAIFAVAVVRVLLHLFAALFGINFWLLPNFFKSDTTWDSFWPLFTAKKMKGSKETILIRLVLIALFFYYSYHIIQDPSIVTENLEITKTIFEDIDQWGIAKLKGERNFSQSALSDYNEMFNATTNEELTL